MRVSTDEQARSGLGLEAQRRAVVACAVRLKLPLVALKTDAGLSGGLPVTKRPGLMELLGLVRPGDVLIVAQRDRLARDRIEIGLLERNLAERGIRIASAAGEGTDGELDDPDAFLQRGLIDLLGEHGRLTIKARTRAALRAKKDRGERVGAIPFGFVCVKGKLVPDPYEQKVIAFVLKLHGLGRSVRRIERVLVTQRVFGRGAKKLGKSQIHRIVQRAAAAAVPTNP